MGVSAPLRKVLIIERDPDIRNVLYTLLAGLGCEGDVAHDGREALAMIDRQDFDAILLDLRCEDPPLEQVMSGIKEIRPSLLGRVLVVTGAACDLRTMEMVERYCLPRVSMNRLLQDFCGRVLALLEPSRAPSTVPPPSTDN